MTVNHVFVRGSAPLSYSHTRRQHTRGGMATSAGRAILLWVPKKHGVLFCGARAAGAGVRQHGARRAAAISTASKASVAVTQQTRPLSSSGLVRRMNCGTGHPDSVGVASSIGRRGVRWLTSGVVSLCCCWMFVGSRCRAGYAVLHGKTMNPA